MKVQSVLFALALALPTAASAQIIVSTSNALAHNCFLAAKAGVKPREGLRLCDAALRNDPLNIRDRAATYGNRGVLQDLANEVEKAETDFRTAIRLDPGLGDPYVNLGSMLIRKKQFDEAIAQIDKGLALGMSFPAVGYYDRALAYDYLGRYREAYRDYQKTLEHDPGFKLASDRLKDFVVTRTPGQS
ncbi:MAG: tetratricopeptide repeat protein [Novosphingobium sp.]|jgi:tetratricopeptide (TPR) repeat protein|nr:tetratricopeptide repeat protein [Novosphingobium sp.]